MNEFARAEHMFRGRRELIETNMSCRYMAALCATKQNKWEEAAALVDENLYPFDSDAAADTNMRSAMLYLTGTIVNRCGDVSRAPDYMKRAMKEDPRCVEAFEWLMKTRLITNLEAQEFLKTLDYSICGQDADFIRLLYQSRAGPFEETQLKELETTYKLAGNHDVLCRRAEALFAQCKFSECIEITSAVHQRNPYYDSIVPMHVSCLSELGNRNDLFYFAHQLGQYFPERPSSWFAVGAYYLMLGKNLDARKYFTMHAPLMHLGTLYLQLENLRLAQEYLSRADEMMSTDPLLKNELGVLHVKMGKSIDGVVCFNRALSLANEGSLPTITWETTRYNLAHAHRKLGNYQAAQRVLEQIIELNQSAVEAHTFLGWISLRLDDPEEAAMHLQTALSLDPNSEIAQDLLKLSMEQSTLKPSNVHTSKSTPAHNSINDDYFLPSDLERHRMLRDPNPRADRERSISNGHTHSFRETARTAAPEPISSLLGTPFAVDRLDTGSVTLPTSNDSVLTPTFAYPLARGPSSSLASTFASPHIRPRRHPGQVALDDSIGVRTPSEQSFNSVAAIPRVNDFAARLIRPPHTPATPSDANISFEMDMDVEDD
ncbi:anaphase promoting complex subunit cdc16 [Geranomyces variabilis]|uniref:Anaphase promoting complex subunit cdc16 n=1 Tax=Geranomyces variabilis TaxID=109894 RepID=A0AAD5XQI5_9FUNG|nr:anaphase promoting complex subunit cdc16 [Geranomyces variabilis]